MRGQRREYGADSRWRSESRREERRERSVERGGRDREGNRSERRRRSRDGQSESRSPRARHRRSVEREEGGRAREESRGQERSDRRHREGSRERGTQDWNNEGRGWSRERRRRDGDERSAMSREKGWDEGAPAEDERRSERRERSYIAAHPERHHRDLVGTSPGRWEDVSRDGGDRWQGGSPEGLQAAGSPVLGHREDGVREKRSHRSRKRQKDEGGPEASDRRRRRKASRRSKGSERENPSMEGERGEPTQKGDNAGEEAPAWADGDRGRWDPDQSHDNAEGKGEEEARTVVLPSIKPDSPASEDVQRDNEGVRAVPLTSRVSVEPDMHLLELRRAVEQSFKRRRLKSSREDGELLGGPRDDKG